MGCIPCLDVNVLLAMTERGKKRGVSLAEEPEERALSDARCQRTEQEDVRGIGERRVLGGGGGLSASEEPSPNKSKNCCEVRIAKWNEMSEFEVEVG